MIYIIHLSNVQLTVMNMKNFQRLLSLSMLLMALSCSKPEIVEQKSSSEIICPCFKPVLVAQPDSTVMSAIQVDAYSIIARHIVYSEGKAQILLSYDEVSELGLSEGAYEEVTNAILELDGDAY